MLYVLNQTEYAAQSIIGQIDLPLAPLNSGFPLWDDLSRLLFRFGRFPLVGPGTIVVPDGASRVQVYGHPPDNTPDVTNRARSEYIARVAMSGVFAAFLRDWDFSKGMVGQGGDENVVSHLNLSGELSNEAVDGLGANIPPNTAVFLPSSIQFVQQGSVSASYTPVYTGQAQVVGPKEYHVGNGRLDYLVSACYLGGPLSGSLSYSSYLRQSPAKFRWYTNGSRIVLHIAEYRVYKKTTKPAGYRHDVLMFRLLLKPIVPSFGVGPTNLSGVLGLDCVRTYKQYYTYYPTDSAGYYPMWTAGLEGVFDALPIDYTSDNPWPGSVAAAYLPRSSRVFFTNFGAGRYQELTGRTGVSYYDDGREPITLASSEDVSSPEPYTLHAFGAAITPYLQDLYPLCHDACRAALEKWSVAMGLNQFEAQQDWFGIMTLVDVVKLLKHIRSLKLSKDIVFEILDVLTDIKLCYSFAVKPTASDVRKIASMASAFKERWITDYSDPYIVRGAYKTSLGDFFSPFNGATVDVRCKMSIDVISDALLRALPLDAVGILPKVSAVWASMPMSFLIDWFLPVGKGLEAAETSTALMMIKVRYTTCSIKVEWECPSDILASYGYTSAGESSGLKYVYYDRIVLPCLPPFLPSRINSLSFEPGVPDWEIAGSLLYKLLR